MRVSESGGYAVSTYTPPPTPPPAKPVVSPLVVKPAPSLPPSVVYAFQSAAKASGVSTSSPQTGGQSPSIASSVSTAAKGILQAGMPIASNGGRVGSSTAKILAVDPNPAKGKTSTLFLQDLTQSKDQNVLRVDGPHMYKGSQLDWHINVERPGSVPAAMKDLNHQELAPLLKAVAPLTSASNLKAAGRVVIGVAVAADVYDAAKAVQKDGYRVGPNTITSVARAGGGWAGAWAGGELGVEAGALLGTPLGPVGMAVGGILGGLVGGVTGSIVGSKAGANAARLALQPM